MLGRKRFGELAVALLLAAAGCTDDIPREEALATSTPPRLSNPPRVLLLGDSILDESGNHAAVALRNMGLDAYTYGVWGSSLFTRNQYDCGELQADSDRFSWLGRASPLIDRIDPDLVFVYLNHNYGPDVPRTREQCEASSEESIALGSPEFARMTRTLLSEFLHRLRRRGARVFLLSPVPMDPDRPAAENPIFLAYLGLKEELGFGVLDAAQSIAAANGGRIESLPDCFGRSARVRPEHDLHLTYFGAGVMGSALANEIAKVLGLRTQGISAPAEQPVALASAETGYRSFTCDAASFAFGTGIINAGAAAYAPTRDALGPVVAAAGTRSGQGYAELFASGRVLTFGDARDFGSAKPPLGPADAPSGIAFTPSGAGYWVSRLDGNVEAFGDAPDFGDLELSSDPVVGIAAHPSTLGYWLVRANGAVHAFGNSEHFGDFGGCPLAHPLVAIAAHPTGRGYWLLDDSGQVFAFGTARHYGNAAGADPLRLLDYGRRLTEPVANTAPAISIGSSATGNGYHVLLRSGAVCHFGDAPRFGSTYATAIDGMRAWLGEPFYAPTSPCE